jgi:hypothetical protein
MNVARPAPPSLFYGALGHYEAQPISSGYWQLADGGRMCSQHGCGQIAVAKLIRHATKWRHAGRSLDTPRRFTTRWHYCVEHLAGYGKWIEDGQVWWWRYVPPGDDPT